MAFAGPYLSHLREGGKAQGLIFRGDPVDKVSHCLGSLSWEEAGQRDELHPEKYSAHGPTTPRQALGLDLTHTETEIPERLIYF